MASFFPSKFFLSKANPKKRRVVIVPTAIQKMGIKIQRINEMNDSNNIKLTTSYYNVTGLSLVFK